MGESRKCEECLHFICNTMISGIQCVRCELTNTIMVSKSAETCKLYNRDISDQLVCFNCKHFLGGSDWGLACSKHYHMLPHALDDMCEDAEWRNQS